MESASNIVIGLLHYYHYKTVLMDLEMPLHKLRHKMTEILTVCVCTLETCRKNLKEYRVNLDVKTGGEMRTQGNAWAIDLELGNMMKND